MLFRRLIVATLTLALTCALSIGLVQAATKSAPAGKVNLNSATTQQLTALPGVGEKLAARIVEYRQKSGGFKSPQELMNVKGIGEKNFQKLQQYVVVGDAAPRAAK
jgi:competence protein ComEA